jgi:hypothetical protein
VNQNGGEVQQPNLKYGGKNVEITIECRWAAAQ